MGRVGAAPAVAAALVTLCVVAARTAPAPAASELSRSTPHLTLAARLDSRTIAANGRVRLTMDVTPAKGMHVYAPGSTYRAVTIRLADGSAFAPRSPVQYPKATLYTFKPLNEQVPVYDTPFTLVAELGLSSASATPRGARGGRGDTLTLKVALDYQACTDRVCYLPASVPLQWTVTVG